MEHTALLLFLFFVHLIAAEVFWVVCASANSVLLLLFINNVCMICSHQSSFPKPVSYYYSFCYDLHMNCYSFLIFHLQVGYGFIVGKNGKVRHTRGDEDGEGEACRRPSRFGWYTDSFLIINNEWVP